LIAAIRDLLDELELAPRALERLVSSRGPGSFTGLRIGLATILGLHEALDVPAVAVSTFAALARQAEPGRPVIAAVDAMRQEWFIQAFAPGSDRPQSPPTLVDLSALAQFAPCQLVSFSTDVLQARAPEGVELVPARPIAPDLLALADDPELEWRLDSLLRPLYLRPPATGAPELGL
jgi:tRNA threonylcarbamoyl adenosine modification protein YeaZ